MKLRLSFVFLALSLLFLSCGSSFSQEGEGYVAVDLYDFVQKISSRSAGTDQNVNVTLWTEGDYVTSVTASVSDSGSDPIILNDIPIKSSISINLEASVGKKNYLGASEKIVVQKGSNPVTIRLTKTVPTTDIVLYNQSNGYYTYYLSKSASESPFKTIENSREFCFDSDGHFYYLNDDNSVGSDQWSDTVHFDNGAIEKISIDLKNNTFYGLQLTDGYLNIYKYPELLSAAQNTQINYSINLLEHSIEPNYDSKYFATYDNVLYAFVGSDTDLQLFIATLPISNTDADITDYKVVNLNTNIGSSYYVMVTDILYQDGAVYILLRETNTEDTGVTSHGAILKYDVASETVTKLVGLAPETSLSEFDAACYANGYGMVLKSQNDNDYYIDHFTDPYTIKAPYKEGVNSYFVGPDKFVAIKPKKLVISDNGLAFYTNSITGLTKKKINRVIEIDLAALSVENANKVDVEYEFRSSYTSANISGITIDKDFSTGDNHYYYKPYQSNEYSELTTANQQLTATIIEE